TPISSVSAEYVKQQEFPSVHQKLTRTDSAATEFHELRTDGSTWIFVRETGTPYLHLSQVVDRHGNSLDLTYDNGLLSEISNSDGSVTIERNSEGRIVSISGPSDRYVAFSYDESNRISSWDRTVKGDAHWDVSTDSDGRVVSINDP